MEKDHTKKKKRWIKTRRQKYLFLSSITTVLILVAIVLVNVLTVYITDRYPVTIDLTPEKVFQLTDQSKEYIENLSAPVSIQVMTSEENFMASGEYYVQAHSVIEQYEKYSDQITLEYVDLLENPSLASAYEDVQIGDIIVSSGNRYQTLTAYDLFNDGIRFLLWKLYYFFQSGTGNDLCYYECYFRNAGKGRGIDRTQ